MERYHIFKLGLAILFYAAYCIRPMVADAQKLDDSDNQTNKYDEADLVFYQGVEGKPGVDFPVFSHIPRTTFSCRNVDSGYYADLETDCQVFHICEDNKKISFLCPNGTIFQQSELICEWWFKVNCTNSPNLYEESAEQLREENARRKLSRRVQNHGAVMRTEERSSTSTKQDNKASKRVHNDGNRINNHAPNYRDNFEQQNNDLSRSPTSDFVRNDEHRSATTRRIQNGRKPVQFQAPASVNSQDDGEDRTYKKNSHRVVEDGRNGNNNQNNRRKTNRNNANEQNSLNNSRNNNRGGTNYANSELGFNGRKKSSHFNDNNKQQPARTSTKHQERFSFSTSNANNNANKVTPSPFINDFQETESTDDNEFSNNQQAFDNRRISSANAFQHQNEENNQKNYQSSDDSFANNNAFRTSSSRPFQNKNHQPGSEGNNQNNYQSSDDSFTNNNAHRTSSSRPFQNRNYQSESERNNQKNYQSSNDNFANNNVHRTSSSRPFQNRNHQSESGRNNQKNYQSPDDNFANNNVHRTSSSRPLQNRNHQSDSERNNEKNYQSSGNSFVNDGTHRSSSSRSFQNGNHQSESEGNNQSSDDSFANNNVHRTSSSRPFQNKNQQSESEGNNQKNYQSSDDSFADDNTHRTSTSRSFQNKNHQSEREGNNQENHQPSDDGNNNNAHRTSSSGSFQDGHSQSERNNQNRYQSSDEDTNPPQSHQSSSFSSDSQSDHFISHNTPTGFQSSSKPEEKEREGKKLTFGDQSTNSYQQFDKVKEIREPVPLNLDSDTQLESNAQSTQKPTSSSDNNKYLPEGKDSNVKQKSTVSLTRNDIVNKRLEASDSDEAQITQETASFYKNSFNKIEQDRKTTSSNPHPNHRTTYSELKEPKYYSTKIYSAISSVTPQYLTTQPINNGRPFIGSQVGTTLNSFGKSTTSYFTTTIPPSTTTIISTTPNIFNIGRTDRTFTTFTTENPTTATNAVPTERFNIGRTDKTLRPVALSTLSTFAPRPAKVTVPAQGSFNLGTTSPKIESSTGRIIDHATVYGKFVKSSSTPSSSGKTSILLSKSLFGGNKVTPSPFSLPTTTHAKSNSVKTSSEILSTSDSFNRNLPQVRFFGKVQSSTSKLPGVELTFNGNNGNSLSTTPKPFSLSSTASSYNSLGTTFGNFPSTTIDPEFNSVSPLSLSTVNPEFNSITPPISTAPTFFSTTDFNSITTLKPKSKTSGFFVTKNGVTTQKSLIGEIIRPRPFQLPPEPDFGGKAVYTTTTTESPSTTPTTTYPTYKISSASPFAGPSSPQPTQPTPFSTATPTLPSTFENVDSMINALAEMASHNNFTDNPRPGLVIPPSAGPQTLHTLAVYFANALDGIASDKEEDNEREEEDEENLTKVELEKKRLTELLTQMTMNRYNELFNEDKEEEETTTVASRSGNDDDDNDLEGQHSKGPAQAPPKVRQLAKVFTQALSSYLDDPATFKKVLEEVRPTEPPALDNEDLGDDELLNFSDADSKSSFPPFFPTPLSIQPTWGYLIAYNTSQNLDVKNSINSDNENLQGADSQSFVSQFNKLQKETTTKSSVQLPEDHWTTSPDVNKLFKTAFSFDPASINENFGTTETISTTTEEGTEEPDVVQHEIQYEVRALPQLELNSTQLHGILIDFMNTTKMDQDNRLQRILKKLNTTEDEFLAKMKEIESNPLTRRLILLLINECGSNNTQQVETKAVPVHTLLGPETLETSSSGAGFGAKVPEPQASSSGIQIVDPGLDENSQDARALQLLNSLYTIASKFGK